MRDQFGWLYWTRNPASFAFAITSLTASREKTFFLSASSGVPSKQLCWKPQIVSRAGGPAGLGTFEKRLRWNVLWKSPFQGLAPGLPRGRCESQSVMSYSVDAVNEVIRKANEAGFLVQYNHPNWSRNVRADWLGLRGLWSLEILNYGADVNTGADYCPYVYDDLLNYVDPGIFCSMGDDNHNRGGSRHGTFGGSTFIGAKELTYEAVVRSMARGEFYCASGVENPPRFLALYAEDGVVHVDCTPVSHVQFIGDGRRFQAKHGAGIVHAEFPLDRNDAWFRIALRDDRGNVANTHAYPVA